MLWCMNVIPDATRDYWTRLGLDVDAEAESLYRRIAAACEEWGLDVIAGPLPGGLTSVVHHVQRDGTDHALKATPRALAALGRDELVALSLWAGQGAVRCVGSAPDSRVRLLEWLDPPGSASEEEVSALVRQLHAHDADTVLLSPLTERVGQMFAWAERMDQDYVPVDTLRRCARAALALAELPPRRVIVHGDLQPKNLMRRGGDLVAIDPIPGVGDGAFDLALWSLTAPGYRDAPRRAARVAEAVGYDPERAIAWTRSLAAVVAAWPQDEARRAKCAQMCS